MTDQQDLPSFQDMVRTEPVQHRSAQRIELLLDAAAELIDENGIDGLTTSDVAARSHSSVGVVYRYFPNIQSLLRALAARNMERLTARVTPGLARESDQWWTALDTAIDAVVDLNRYEPGFRALRLGDVIDERFLDPERSNNGVLARTFAGVLGSKYGFKPDEELVFHLEVVVEISDGLIKRAFLIDRDGDERFIHEAHELVQSYMRDHLDLPSAQ